MSKHSGYGGDKKKRRTRNFSEDSQEQRGSRVGFKNYLQQIKEQEMQMEIDDQDLDQDDSPLNE